jgi:hypothetical protein
MPKRILFSEAIGVAFPAACRRVAAIGLALALLSSPASADPTTHMTTEGAVTSAGDVDEAERTTATVLHVEELAARALVATEEGTAVVVSIVLDYLLGAGYRVYSFPALLRLDRVIAGSIDDDLDPLRACDEVWAYEVFHDAERDVCTVVLHVYRGPSPRPGDTPIRSAAGERAMTYVEGDDGDRFPERWKCVELATRDALAKLTGR